MFKYNSRSSRSSSSRKTSGYGAPQKSFGHSGPRSGGSRPTVPGGRQGGGGSSRSGGNFNRRPNSGGSSRFGGGRSGGSRFGGGGRSGGGGGRFGRGKPKGLHPDVYVARAKVDVVQESIYDETMTYADFDLHEKVQQNIVNSGYVHPTKVQSQSIPHALAGRDVLALASTGSGKTAAFLIPMINKIYLDRTQRCLVLSPTRELAEQTQEEFNKLAGRPGPQSVVVIGGASMGKQKALLARKPHFVMATPGRLKDLANQRAINLKDFNNIVLDEVDRMLDMGFIADIKHIIAQLPEQKQSIFLSATMSREANGIADELLNDPVKIEVSKQAPQANVDQDVVRVSSGKQKLDVLHELLIQETFVKTLIFSRTKHGSERLSKELSVRGFRVDAIHGDKSQNLRSRVITKFKDNAINILVATDVAARGLDIKDITHVINYDEPATYEDYIHRIGRTGRIGKKGTALTFIG